MQTKYSEHEAFCDGRPGYSISRDDTKTNIFCIALFYIFRYDEGFKSAFWKVLLSHLNDIGGKIYSAASVV